MIAPAAAGCRRMLGNVLYRHGSAAFDGSNDRRQRTCSIGRAELPFFGWQKAHDLKLPDQSLLENGAVL